nr:cysteine-rich receptor-like protein kinase 25 isoform X2 [Arachis hypogaea]
MSRSLNSRTLFLILISTMLMKHGNSMPTYNYHDCKDPLLENATTGAIFQSDLTSLLSPLSLAASSKSFHKANVSTRLYGLFLCRADVSQDTCKNCTITASIEIKSKCASNSSAVIWYDECMLRYSKEQFFGVAQTKPLVFAWNIDDNNSTSPTETHLNAQALMYQLIEQASSRDMLFSVGKYTVNDGSEDRYGLVQCTRDINRSSCASCLSKLMERTKTCCGHSVGWRLLAPTCTIRYEKDIFYDSLEPLVSPNTSKPILPSKDNRNRTAKLLILHMVIPIAVFMLFCLIWSAQPKERRNQGEQLTNLIQVNNLKSSSRSYFKDQGMIALEDNKGEIQCFSLSTIKVATNSFSDDTKLGEGGFGPVFKGKLNNGKEIAVKRLSFKSRQGIEEFKNEVTLIAKLQHKNLVRLLGCCLDRNEKLLVYEYMANTGLDAFLFDQNKRGKLDWPKREKIINGIARGLSYLHEDSRLKIIHRDLKASNVLLDQDMNPKISDFGTARIFYSDQIEASTERVVGTYGYMAPEYALEGSFSVKSDVYSFGVLMLEILSGRKNIGFFQPERRRDQTLTLISYAWRLWSEGKELEFLDHVLVNACPINVALRWIHIGLLCVQERPKDRPTMSSVILMLGSTTALPLPLAPPFSLSNYYDNTSDEFSITEEKEEEVEEGEDDNSNSFSVKL